MEEAGSGKGGRTYIQEEAATTTKGGRSYTREGRSFSHSKNKEAAPTTITIRPQLQRRRSALAHKKDR
jgi:hypothetical protein